MWKEQEDGVGEVGRSRIIPERVCRISTGLYSKSHEKLRGEVSAGN